VHLDSKAQKALQHEVGLMKTLRHPNVKLLLGVVLDPPAVVGGECVAGHRVWSA